MKKICFFFVLSLCVATLFVGCKNPETPKFARWELDSLREISPLTPVCEESNTCIAGKWAIAKWGDNAVFSENQYVRFLPDGTFVLSYTSDADSEFAQAISTALPDFTPYGTYSCSYKCYDAVWSGSTNDGEYGVVLITVLTI